MNPTLMEELLNEPEGQTLDFKEEQYKFAGASDTEKSEIIKDILIFANAWRRTDAYILIGVEEVKGGRSIVRGIRDHLDDASLQQFVNSKAQRPVTFSYETFPFEGKQVGIIKVPCQERPFYLTKNYGKLQKEVVYIRRGSSTDIATIDEIAKMGGYPVSEDISPRLRLNFAKRDDDSLLGTNIKLVSEIVNYDVRKIPPLDTVLFSPLSTNTSYRKERAAYIQQTSLLKQVLFALTNTGPVLATNVELSLTIKKDPKIVLIDRSDYPGWPSKESRWMTTAYVGTNHLFDSYSVYDKKDNWKIRVNFGNIQPKMTVTPSGCFYVGAKEPCTIDLEGYLFGDNIPDPISTHLTIEIDTISRELNFDELEDKK